SSTRNGKDTVVLQSKRGINGTDVVLFFRSKIELFRAVVPNPWATAHSRASDSALMGREILVKSRSQRSFKSFHLFLAL
ncbi:hypothetical protein AVEN_86011-1, partial [Araneus ventricosus]